MTTMVSVHAFPIRVAQATDEDIRRDLAHISEVISDCKSPVLRHFYEAAEVLLLAEQNERKGTTSLALSLLLSGRGGVQ